MNNHKVERNLRVVGEFKSCKRCRRVHWLWAGPEINREKMPAALPLRST